MYTYPTDIIFSEQHKNEMLQSAINGSWKNHTSHYSGTNQPYQVIADYTGQWTIDDSIYRAKEIVTKRIKEPAAIYVMRLPPWKDMHIHTDTYTKPNEYRRTILMTLLSPRNFKEETRLEYYKEDKTTIEEKYIYDERSVVTNPIPFHRCFNQTPEWRYSLQITFRDDYEDILKILNKNE